MSPDLEAEARRVLAWHAIQMQARPRRPVLYGPGLLQQAMRELATVLAPRHRVFVRDGQLVRLVRAGEILGLEEQSWHSQLSEDALLFVVMRTPQEIIVESDPVSRWCPQVKPLSSLSGHRARTSVFHGSGCEQLRARWRSPSCITGRAWVLQARGGNRTPNVEGR